MKISTAFLRIGLLVVITAIQFPSLHSQSHQTAESPQKIDVTYPGGDVTLAGTLTLPVGEESHPAVILVSGSGPQNRDGETRAIPGYSPFKQIAEYLSKRGFAVLRYDDRGVGNSTGDYLKAKEQDFIQDAEASLRFLLTRPDIRRDAVGFLGHSEGSLIAASVAGRNSNAAFVISLGGGAVDGIELLLKQAERQALAEGKSREEAAAVVKEQSVIFDLVLQEKWEDLTTVVTEFILKKLEDLPEQQRASISDPKKFASARAARSVQNFKIPRYKELLSHDFGEDWRHVKVPVLAVFGGLDTQCDAEQNSSALQCILAETGNDDVTLVEIPEANHLFLKARTGSITEYGRLSNTLVPELLNHITAWLQKRFLPVTQSAGFLRDRTARL